MKGEPVFEQYHGNKQMNYFFNKTKQDIANGLKKYPNTLTVHTEQWLEFKNEDGNFITIVITEGSLKPIYEYFQKIPFGSGRPEREEIISEDDIINLIIDMEQNL